MKILIKIQKHPWRRVTCDTWGGLADIPLPHVSPKISSTPKL